MEKRFEVMGKVYNAIVFYDNETKTHKSLSPKAVIDLLNEQDEAIKMLKDIKGYDIGELLAENIKLKQHLAEKDKKIEEINKFISLFDCDDFNDFKIFFGACMLAPLYWCRDLLNHSPDDRIYISVDSTTRIITIHYWLKHGGHSFTWHLDVLYDLIKAGMVEVCDD